MSSENGSYNADVMAGAGGRPPQKEAPPFGRRMATLRRQKGLSQTELAQRLGTTQKTVDYYERRTLNPTLDVIQKVADALEVPPAQLIGDNNGSMKISLKTGPTSKLQKIFEDVARLPRRQQEKIVEVVSALMTQYESRQ